MYACTGTRILKQGVEGLSIGGKSASGAQDDCCEPVGC